MGSGAGESSGAVGDGSAGLWDLAVVGLDWDHIGGFGQRSVVRCEVPGDRIMALLHGAQVSGVQGRPALGTVGGRCWAVREV